HARPRRPRAGRSARTERGGTVRPGGARRQRPAARGTGAEVGAAGGASAEPDGTDGEPGQRIAAGGVGERGSRRAGHLGGHRSRAERGGGAVGTPVTGGAIRKARRASNEVALNARRVMERRKRARFPPAGSGDNVPRSQKHPPQKASPPVIFADSLPDAK